MTSSLILGLVSHLGFFVVANRGVVMHYWWSMALEMRRVGNVKWSVVLALVFFLTGGTYEFFALSAPVSKPQLHLDIGDKIHTSPVTISWPSGMETAVAVGASPRIMTSGAQTAHPMASTAKLMLALAILDKKPIAKGSQGDSLTIDLQDVRDYDTYLAAGGSIAAVQVGEVLTERQALEALMLPSADNVANTLARWGFGSLEAYADYANQKARTLGMTDTHFIGASGYNLQGDQSVSTPSDLVRLGMAAVGNEALSSIVAEKTATIPVAGVIENTNILLGQYGIDGLKTGHTPQAGGCLVFSALREVAGRQVRVVGAAMGAVDKQPIFDAVPGLLDSVLANVTVDHVESGKAVAHLSLAWSGVEVSLLADTSLAVLRWRDEAAKVQTHDVEYPRGYHAAQGTAIGRMTVTSSLDSGAVKLVLATPLTPPSPWWLLSHPPGGCCSR